MTMGQRHPWLVALATLLCCGHQLVSGQGGDVPNDLSAVFDLREESPPATFVGNVASGAGLSSVFNISTLQSLAYRFIPQPGSKADHFVLDPATGDLRTGADEALDREGLCPGEETCFLVLDVAISRRGEPFQVITVTVNIDDVNDQTPVFTPPQTIVRFSESDPAGTVRDLPVALDLDSPVYGVAEYRLALAVDEFELVQVNNPINGLIDLKLRLHTALDREARDSYQVRVEALDHGQPPLVGNLVVQVTVEDDNDHSPEFSSGLYEVQVSEDFVPETAFFTIEARDNDEGDNGRIVYGFSPRTTIMHGDLFSIEAQTGEVSLTGALDYEREDVYHLEVTASDLGANPRSSLTTVKVTVLDVNDNSPSVTISTLTDKVQAEISENVPRGKFTAHVSVVDADSGSNGVVTCSLSHPLFELDMMKPNQYKIVTAMAFDREDTDTYLLTVDCSDLGRPSLMSSANLTVKILDENDNTPRFSQFSYSAAVPENLEENTRIVGVSATDADLGDNAAVSYRILQKNVSAFVKVDAASGDILAADVLDYEEVQELRFTVRASDGGVPPRFADVPVTIRILDTNDEAPHFLNNHYIFYVSENQDADTYLGRVTADDPDSSPFDIFEYSMTKQNPLDQSLFYIDSINGNIYTSRTLDHEERSLYYLNLYATDLDDPSHVGSATVTVIVQDLNDNAPLIHFPLEPNSTFPISNQVPVSYNITKIFATDPDSGANSNISYTLYYGNTEVFRIDPKQGFIQTNVELTGLSRETFELGVRVTDGGDPALHTDVTVTILVDSTVPFYVDDGTDGVPHKTMVQRTNLTIIIAVGAVSGLVIVVLLIAIVVLKTTDCRAPRGAFATAHGANTRKHDNNTGTGAKVFSDLNIKAVEANGYNKAPPHPLPPPAHTQIQIPSSHQTGHGHVGLHSQLQNQSAQPRDDACHSLHPDVVHKLERETDGHSVSSADVSNTDSGRGASEQGEDGATQRHTIAQGHPRYSSYRGITKLNGHGITNGSGYHGDDATTQLPGYPVRSGSSQPESYATINKPHRSHHQQQQLQPSHNIHGSERPYDPTNGAHGYHSVGDYHKHDLINTDNTSRPPAHLEPHTTPHQTEPFGSAMTNGSSNNNHGYSGHHGNVTNVSDSHKQGNAKVARAGPKRIIHAVNV